MGASQGQSPEADGKTALRARMRRLRAGLTPEDRERLAASIEERLFDLPAVRDAQVVMVFASFGSEVPTDGIVDRLDREGRTVVMPIVADEGLRAVRYRPGDPMVDTSYGPREPAHRTPLDPTEIDVVITPGLAFDRSGSRLGYGRAYYDRFLAELGPNVVRIGIGFHGQLVASVPAGPKDVPVDVVVTDREVVRCRHPEQVEPG